MDSMHSRLIHPPSKKTLAGLCLAAFLTIPTGRASAAVIAYESFDGAHDPDDSLAGYSGSGLSAWQLTSSNASITAPTTGASATITGPGTGFTTGNGVTLQSSASQNVYAVASFLGSDLTPGGLLPNGTYYLSMLLDLTSDSTRFTGMMIRNSAGGEVAYWGIASGNANWGIGSPGNASTVSHNVTGPTQLVLRLDISATGKSYKLFVNPLGEEGSLTPNASSSHTNTSSIASIAIGVGNGGGSGSAPTTIAIFDELIVATSWSDVVSVPEPDRAMLLLGSLGLMVLRRRRADYR